MADLAMIVRMVIYKCRELNNPVTETLAAYVAQTTMNARKLQIVVSNPVFLLTFIYSIETGRFYLETQITEEEAKALVDITINRLQQI